MVVLEEATMPTYVIERNLPGAGALSSDELRAISAKSNAVLRELGPDIRWAHSYVTSDKIYCVYDAKNPELVREHARRGGFPADTVNEIRATIDPATGQDR
jgi:hypothetical protein